MSETADGKLGRRDEADPAAPWPARGGEGPSSDAAREPSFDSIILPADISVGGRGKRSTGNAMPAAASRRRPTSPMTSASRARTTGPAPGARSASPTRAPSEPPGAATATSPAGGGETLRAPAGRTPTGQVSSLSGEQAVVPSTSTGSAGSAARPGVPSPPAAPTPEAPVVDSVEVLQRIGPEHFKRTLIAPMRPYTPRHVESAGVGGVRAVQITPHVVAASLSDPRLYMIHDPDSPQAASFRVLRYRLAERGDPRTIAVTSAEVGDGKTTCAVNLAIALSECGRARVLLIEGNFRHPAIAQMLGMTPPVCAARQITEQHQQPSNTPWQMAQVTSPWLHVLAVDPQTFQQPGMLDEPAFDDTLSQLKLVGYDYIVVDTPPVLGSADVNLLQDLSDGVLFALWARRSSTRALATALDQLAPTKMIGAVLLDA